MSRLESLIKVSGIIIMFYIVINFYFFVAVAMMHDGTVVVHFDKLGEGLFETIMYVLISPLIFASFVLEVKHYLKGRKKT